MGWIWGIPGLRCRHHSGDAQRILNMQDRNPKAARAHTGIICMEEKVEVWV